MPPLRVVLDANVAVSALLRPDSPPGRVLRAAIAGEAVCLVTSPPLLDELRAVLDTPRLRRRLALGPGGGAEFVLMLEQVAEPADLGAHPAPGICRDPDDEVYLQTALAGRADFLVSGDDDLLALGDVGGIPIVSPAGFERIAGARRPEA